MLPNYFSRSTVAFGCIISGSYGNLYRPSQFVLRFDLLLLSFERVLLLSTASPPRYRGRCWAAIRMSHRPEPSGRAVRGGVDGLDSGGRHGRWFVLRHTHRPQKYPICTGRSGNVRHRCGGGWAGPRLFLGGSFRGVGACVGDENAESCVAFRPLSIPLVIRPLHRTYVVVVRQTDEMLCGGYMLKCWVLKWSNVSAAVVVAAEKIWKSQMLSLPCSSRMSSLQCMKLEEKCTTVFISWS